MIRLAGGIVVGAALAYLTAPVGPVVLLVVVGWIAWRS